MDKQTAKKPVFKRILLKLSGEALQGDRSSGIDDARLSKITQEIISVTQLGVQVALVIGGGNLIRGTELSPAGIDRVTGDQMGMLATIMNGLALRQSLEKKSIPVFLMSAIGVPSIAAQYNNADAMQILEQGHVVILSGGTGCPLVTTDTASALRAIEIRADIVIKATKVDGVYSADPVKHPNAERYQRLSYAEVISKRLGVMDMTAMMLAEEHRLPIRVFNMNKEGALKQIILGEEIGTLVSSGE